MGHANTTDTDTDEDLVLVHVPDSDIRLLEKHYRQNESWVSSESLESAIRRLGGGRRTDAAARLGPLVQTLRATGLGKAGYRAALADRFPAGDSLSHFRDERSIADRMARARSLVISSGADPLLVADDALLLWQNPETELLAWIPLLGGQEIRAGYVRELTSGVLL